MADKNILDYADSRSLRKGHLCDGFCINCPEKEVCPFPRAEKIRDGYRDSGDDKFNARVLDVFGFKSRYGTREHGSSSKGDYGFSTPDSSERDYSRRDYSNPGLNYNENSENSGGFHGSYDSKSPDGGYSSMTPRGGKSNYCVGCEKK